MESADLDANARALRAGVTIVGTRPRRTIRLPGLLLLDGARLLTDGFEIVNALPLHDAINAPEILARASGVASAAGSPWGVIFRATSSIVATNGYFDGTKATAFAEGVQYTLGPVENWRAVPEAARLRQRGNYVLELRDEQEEQPIALFAFRPRLAPGVQALVDICKRYGVELALLGAGDQLALQALARRTHIPLLEDGNALEVIAARQRDGALVAFVSDSAGAGAGFAACDLAIGLTDDRSRFTARADLLAPDLAAVAAIIEAGAKREPAVRDAVVLSIASNIIGMIWGFEEGQVWRARRAWFLPPRWEPSLMAG